jgi:carbon storage regulator
MLIVTRKTDESIVIETGHETLEIKVLETAKDRVKIGVDAPREVKIIRNELLIAESSNVEASQAVSKNVLDELLNLSQK